MSFDYYAALAESKACPIQVNEAGLASGFVDGCTVWSTRGRNEKTDARTSYMQQAQSGVLNFPEELARLLDPTPCTVQPGWLLIEVSFTLQTPWYSKDDRVFHVLDNPLHKDRVFGVPFMPASSWKGMLRWACRMEAGLGEYLEKNHGKIDGWRDPDWILHLFGNEKGEEQAFQQGALVFYPTWFDKVSFEVINPHSRERRAGTHPIYYEVVPPGGSGTFQLLYAPWPEIRAKVNPKEALPKLLKAIKELLTIFGISAKRTVGWGTARINSWEAFAKGRQPVKKDGPNWEDLWKEVESWFNGGTMRGATP